MRILNQVELSRIQILTEHSIQFTLIEPTKTGLNKSILDATNPVRQFLKERNVHDYHAQQKGDSYKIKIKSYFICPNKLVTSIASLYRPVTKQGDPRIWFKSLADYARPNDIIAIFEFERNLYLLNITDIDMQQLLNERYSNPLQEFLQYFNNYISSASLELLTLLKALSKKGPIPGLLKADTSIGRTLESMLGIPINSSKKPDYKGIEIKSFRDKRRNRKTLFAQVANWQLSKFKSSDDILSNFGYFRGSQFKMYCTVSTRSINSQGLQLRVDNKLNRLVEFSHKTEINDFAVWELDFLHNRLIEKHSETFWVAVESVLITGLEHFILKKVEHTKQPILSQFDILLEQGIITLDHLIKRTESGHAKEKGPIFKINGSSSGLLFPPSKLYQLNSI